MRALLGLLHAVMPIHPLQARHAGGLAHRAYHQRGLMPHAMAAISVLCRPMDVPAASRAARVSRRPRLQGRHHLEVAATIHGREIGAGPRTRYR